MGSVADPGFPIGGGVPTSDMGVFQQKHMQKRKNWITFEGTRASGSPPGSANGDCTVTVTVLFTI